MSLDALLIKLADMLYNSYDQPAEKAAIRMMKNTSSILLKRKDLTEPCCQLAELVFNS